MSNVYVLKGNVLKPQLDEVSARRRVKRAKVHLANLEKIAYVFNLNITGLAAYEIYPNVKRVLAVMRLERSILDFKLKELKKIVDSGGKE